MVTGNSALNIVNKFQPGVRRVVDAKTPVSINVSAHDCAVGASGKADECAMARALKRKFDGAIVSKAIAYLIKGDTAYRYRVPSSVRTEIVSFDRHHDFRPGSYHLSAPCTTERLAAKRKNRKPSEAKRKTGKPVRRRHLPDGVRSL